MKSRNFERPGRDSRFNEELVVLLAAFVTPNQYISSCTSIVDILTTVFSQLYEFARTTPVPALTIVCSPPGRTSLCMDAAPHTPPLVYTLAPPTTKTTINLRTISRAHTIITNQPKRAKSSLLTIMSGHHHAPSLNVWAIGAMSSVLVIYLGIKSPLKYKWAKESRISPKADLAWRNASQKWLDNQL